MNKFKSLAKNVRKQIANLSARELIIILSVFFIFLLIINYLLSPTDQGSPIIAEGERIKIANDPRFRQEILTEYPQLSRRLPYIGDGCKLTMDRKENGDEFLSLQLLNPEATRDNCGAVVFIKQNLSILNGIEIIEIRTSYEAHV